MLEPETSAVDSLMTAAVPPIGIYSSELLTAAALFDMEVIRLFIRVDRAPAAVAPINAQARRHGFSKLSEGRVRHWGTLQSYAKEVWHEGSSLQA
jgi:hypothetical protein